MPKLFKPSLNVLFVICFATAIGSSQVPITVDLQQEKDWGVRLLAEGKCWVEAGEEVLAESVLKEAVFYLKRTTEQVLAGEALTTLARLYAKRSTKWHEAISHHHKAIHSYLTHADSSQVAVVENISEIGILYYHLQECDSAQHYQKKALSLYQHINQSAPDLLLGGLYNRTGVSLLCGKNFAQASPYFEQALTINMAIQGEQGASIITTYGNIASVALRKGEHTEAIKYYQKAIELALTTNSSDLGELSTFYNNVAYSHYYLDQLNQAMSYAKKALALSYTDTEVEKLQPGTASQFNNLAVMYRRSGDFARAALHFEQTLQIQNAVLEPDHPNIALTISNIGINLVNAGEWEQGIGWLTKSLEKEQQITRKPSESKAKTLVAIGKAYTKLGQIENAEASLLDAFKQMQSVVPDDHPNMALVKMELATLYLEQEAFNQAVTELEGSIRILQASYGEFHGDIALAYSLLAEVHAQQGEMQQFDKYIELALNANNYNRYESFQYDSVINHRILLQTLINTLKYSEAEKPSSNGVEGLQQQIIIADSLVGYLWSKLDENRSRSTLIHEAKIFYETAILQLTKNQPFYLLSQEKQDIIFNFFERSKALLLLQTYHLENIDLFESIPDTLREKEKEFEKRIALLEGEKYKTTKTGGSTEFYQVELLRDIVILKDSLFAIRKNWQEQFPKYFELRNRRKLLSLSQVRAELLQTDQSILEYFIGPNYVFSLVVNKEKVYFHSCTKDFPLEQWVQDMRRGVLNSALVKASIAKPFDSLYLAAAYNLYQKLFSPLADQLSPRVIIIPDETLSDVPFDALITQRPALEHSDEYRHHAYLLYQHTFSYSYGVGFLLELQNREYSEQDNEWLGFAPEFQGKNCLEIRAASNSDDFRNKNYCHLPHSVQEVRQLAQILGGKTLLNSLATKARFLDQAPRQRIIHLATHAKSDHVRGGFSFLVFHPQAGDSMLSEVLFSKDLASVPLQAEMVVLSACETNTGEWQKGEGVISLARGFFEAGARSLISTSWQVEDEVAKSIMLDFYTYLKQGLPKDEALRNAKLNYLKKEQNAGHPFFWSGWVATGEMAPLYNKDNLMIKYGLTTLLLLLLGRGGWQLWKRRTFGQKNLQRLIS